MPAAASAQQTLTFEGFAPFTVLSNQYLGVNFQGATILTQGAGLNPPFPPKSGVNLVYNPVGPMELLFGAPIAYFQGHFTYNDGLTLQGYDAGNNLLATSLGAFSMNSGGSGNPDNELIRIDAANMVRVVVTGGGGNNFTLDDAQFTGSVAVVPEPSTVVLLAAGLAGVFVRCRRRAV
ncbi:MAG: PEP-CTERM sorting domain-containing protein [Gemmatimonadota bacterium]|nr:PEP-CTERM sorting domain-containing protein [Gemmatimonadota bacterium]MDQ8168563.1 PEP-CTERM sorting domain-containing protein [Gemmatimonadota bacterium]MDQ8173351.1 PEP-CTERM sorting domain-containing protein [Gemmatimonadota bacterium]